VLKLGILLIAIGFLVGCTSSKEDALIQSYQQKIDYHKQLQKTEKIQLFENNVTKIVLTATYLYKPNFEKKDTRDEQFIIGFHLEDASEMETNSTVTIFGIRDVDDIKKMKDKQKEESKVVDNSLYSDMMRLMDAAKNTDTLNTTNKKQRKDTITEENESKESKDKVEKYGLMLQGNNAIEIHKLNNNDERLKDISYVTEWGSYYLVTFEHTDKKRFSLVFNSEKYGKGTFYFAKVAKYIYSKKGF